ncbi:MAG: hypothetical protein QXT67_07675 [Candidatus Bathyarchaeia archaeon]
MNFSDPLNDRRVQALLNKFMSGKVKALTPLFDLKKVLVYPEVEEIVGDSESAEDFLSKLHECGILKRELYDKIVCCPKCESVNVSILYSCPFCGSFDIERSSLIEHIKCGYMDVEEKFRNKDGFICPKCGRKLAEMDVDFRRAGVWCTCNKCGRSFDIPVPRHFCRNCQTKFAFEDAKLKDAYTYSLNEDVVKTAAMDWAILAPIGKLLEDRDFKVETPGFIEDRSGVRHMFDMIVSNNGRKPYKIAININRRETSPRTSHNRHVRKSLRLKHRKDHSNSHAKNKRKRKKTRKPIQNPHNRSQKPGRSIRKSKRLALTLYNAK